MIDSLRHLDGKEIAGIDTGGDTIDLIYKGDRPHVRVFNQGGHDHTSIDLLDLIQFVRTNAPGMLRDPEQCHICGYHPGSNVCSAMHEAPQALTPSPSNLDQIVAERDFLYDLLMRVVKETHLLQDEHYATNNLPQRQRIYMFTASNEDHVRIQDLLLRVSLGRTPTPTPLVRAS